MKKTSRSPLFCFGACLFILGGGLFAAGAKWKRPVVPLYFRWVLLQFDIILCHVVYWRCSNINISSRGYFFPEFFYYRQPSSTLEKSSKTNFACSYKNLEAQLRLRGYKHMIFLVTKKKQNQEVQIEKTNKLNCKKRE